MSDDIAVGYKGQQGKPEAPVIIAPFIPLIVTESEQVIQERTKEEMEPLIEELENL